MLSHSSRGWNSEIKVLAGLSSLKLSRRESFFVSLSFWWLLATFGFPWLAEAEAPILWLPDANGQLTGKTPDAGKD